METLQDLGESAIVEKLVSRHLGAASDGLSVGVGDDAAVFRTLPDGQELVATIDACPTPVVDILGVGGWADWGRLAGVISLSDLAAMGATPLAMLSSTYMPPTMSSESYERFLEGLSRVCKDFGVPIAGGNIREGANFAATTVGLGTCEAGRAFRRSEAQPGDTLVVVGRAGVFWSGVLELMSGAPPSDLEPSQRESLWAPVPRLREAAILRSLGAVTAAMDCSDGLGAAVHDLCLHSKVGAILRYHEWPIDLAVERAAVFAQVPLERLLLSWGDWQLIAALKPSKVANALKLLRAEGTQAFVAGTVTSTPGVLEEWQSRFGRRPLDDTLASRRFEDASYLQSGLEGYVTRLRQGSRA